jgi:hypothetical protein
VSGTVEAIRDLQGNAQIPFDYVVLSATGSKRTSLMNKIILGDEVRITQEISHYQIDCNTPLSGDFTKTFAGINGNFVFLRGGVMQSTTNPGLTNDDPRTAIAFNSNYIYYMVVDGRGAGGSIGMSTDDMANFCINQLAATDAVNQDGGGSSTMWVKGLGVVNHPSDGSQRAVANGIMMVSLLDNSARSATFGSGQQVRSTSSLSLRAGPGTNYGSFATIAADVTGAIDAHTLNGTTATGSSIWWKVQFGSTTGWAPENQLAPVLSSVGPLWHLY